MVLVLGETPLVGENLKGLIVLRDRPGIGPRYRALVT